MDLEGLSSGSNEVGQEQKYISMDNIPDDVDESQEGQPEESESQEEPIEHADEVEADTDDVDGEEDSEGQRIPADSNHTEATPKKKLGGFQRKIQNLKAENEKLLAEIEYLRESTEGLSSKPVMEDDEDYNSYYEKLAEHKAAEKMAERDAKRARELARQVELNNARTIAEKVIEFGGQSLLDKVIEVNPKSSEYLTEVLVESEHAGALLAHFCDNPEEAERLSKMEYKQQVKHLAKLEQALEGKQQAQQKSKVPVSKAPTPLQKPKGTGGVVKGSNGDYRLF